MSLDSVSPLNVGRTEPYDTGGFWNNMVAKYPGWRAREGFGQPALGVPGEADDPEMKK